MATLSLDSLVLVYQRTVGHRAHIANRTRASTINMIAQQATCIEDIDGILLRLLRSVFYTYRIA